MVLKNLRFAACLLAAASAIATSQAAYPQESSFPIGSPLPQIASDQDVAVTNIRFGVMRQISATTFAFDRETTVLPKRLKSTGFRFCVTFESPQREVIEWYVIMRFPTDVKDVSGGFSQTEAQTLRTENRRSDEGSNIESFWFDEGDPLGRYTLELHVNGVLRHTVQFDVVPVLDI